LLEAAEEAEKEADQGFIGLAEVDGGVRDFECAVAEGAAEIEALFGRHALQKSGDALGKGLRPDGVKAEGSRKNGRGGLGGLSVPTFRIGAEVRRSFLTDAALRPASPSQRAVSVCLTSKTA